MDNYIFTNNWFESTAKNIWDQMIPQIKPNKVLEVGSYEGASTCYLIDTIAKSSELEIRCIDTWEGSVEHINSQIDMRSVEDRFDYNTTIAAANKSKISLIKLKGFSDFHLSKLIAEGKSNYFDFVYIDGSHQAPDVLCDAILGFRLLKIGGYMGFDDYLWVENISNGKDPLRCPKMAIDAFVNTYFRKLNILQAPLYQLYIQKISN